MRSLRCGAGTSLKLHRSRSRPVAKLHPAYHRQRLPCLPTSVIVKPLPCVIAVCPPNVPIGLLNLTNRSPGHFRDSCDWHVSLDRFRNPQVPEAIDRDRLSDTCQLPYLREPIDQGIRRPLAAFRLRKDEIVSALADAVTLED